MNNWQVAKHFPCNFLEHLLRRLYSVDAPDHSYFSVRLSATEKALNALLLLTSCILAVTSAHLPFCSDWRRAMTLTSSEESDRAGVCGAWPMASTSSTDDEGLMMGLLAALRSSSLSADEQQRRLNAMIVELQQLRRNLKTPSSPSSSVTAAVASVASVLPPTRGYRNSPVCLTALAD